MKDTFAPQTFDAGTFRCGTWTGVKSIAPSDGLRRGERVTGTLRRGDAATATAMRRGAVLDDTLRRS